MAYVSLIFVKVLFSFFFGRIRKIAKSDSSLHHVCLSVCLPACLPVRPSLRMEQLGSHWIDFHEIRPLSRILIHVKLQIGERSKTANWEKAFKEARVCIGL